MSSLMRTNYAGSWTLQFRRMKAMNATTPCPKLSIRTAQTSDVAAIEHIETAADLLFIEAFDPERWPPATPGAARLEQGGFLLVGELSPGEVVGFAHVIEAQDDEHGSIAHLEQVSVLPELGKRGYGRALVEAAMREARERGHYEITLRTYAELPWNAPFYRRIGFIESEPHGTFLEGLIAAEQAEGLEHYGRRVQMTVPLD